jgi:hypothetical protein
LQVENVTAKYVMKCDDDTFVRVDRVLEEVKAAAVGHGLYMGSMNEFHRPLRSGKWAVTYEVSDLWESSYNLFLCTWYSALVESFCALICSLEPRTWALF